MITPTLHNHRMDYSNNSLSTFNRMDFIMDGKNVYTTSFPEVMPNEHSKTTFSENLIPLLKKKFLAHLIHPDPPKEQPATIYKNYYSLPPPNYTVIEKEVEKKPKKKKPKKPKKPVKDKDVKYVIKAEYNDKFIGKGKSKKKDEHWYDGWNPFSCDEEKEDEEEEHYDHKKYHYEHKEEEMEEEKEESESEEESEEDEHSWKRKSKKLKSKLKKKKKLLVKILIGLFLFFAFKCLLETYFYYFFPSFTTTGRDEEYLTEENPDEISNHQEDLYQQRKLFLPKCGNKHQRRF